MALRIRDVVDIPTHKPPLVVKVGEINDEERKAFHAREYVITDTVAEGLRRVLRSVAESADKGFPGQGIWVSGSFGTGKSHFLSFVGMLLRGEPAAWARGVPGLEEGVRATLEKRRVFVVPFNSLDRPDDFRLGLYEAVARELKRQGLPEVELTYFDGVLQWFEDQARETPALWDTLFRKSVLVGSQKEYEEQKATPQGRERLAREIAQSFALPTGVAGFAVEVAEGIRRITQRLREHGFAAVVFLIDELTLFLMNAQDRTRPLVELKALLEAEGALLPVWALVVRHAPLEDVVRDAGKDILDNVKGRFASRDVDIQDVDLYEVLGKRVLRVVPGREKDRDEAIQESLGRIPREQLEVLHHLYGERGFREAVRALYPFHPAIVDTLVSVTHLLSRERTAISVLYDMLFDLADEPLGTLLPHHRAFHYLIGQASESELRDRPALLAARTIWKEKVLPLLEEHFVGDPKRMGRGRSVAESILLGQLTDKGTPLRGRMTPEVIAALNASVLNAKVAILAQEELEEIVDLLCNKLLGTFRREGKAVVVELTLGLDPQAELRKVTQDVTEQRRQAVLGLLRALFGTDEQGQGNLRLKWRGTVRKGVVQAVEVGATQLPLPEPKADFALWVAFPRFPGDPPPPLPRKNAVPGALWIPKEGDEGLRQQLDNLARILFLTESPSGKAYVAEKYSGEEGRRLEEGWKAAAYQLRESLQNGLQALYRGGQIFGSVPISGSPPGGESLQDALKEVGARLLDACFRQHPEFLADVTPQALESLYQAFVKGEGAVSPDMGQPHTYAGQYGPPLRITRPAGLGYALDLGNSTYIQAIEKELEAGGRVRLKDIQEAMQREFGLQPFVTEFLARLMVVFRDLRVVRVRGPVPIPHPAELNLQPEDALTQGRRVDQGHWAAFSHYCRALGVGALPDQPSVRHQDAAWAGLQQFVEEQRKAYDQARKEAAEAAKAVDGPPEDLKTALDRVKGVLEALDKALAAGDSEEGIVRLAQERPPERSLPDMLGQVREMVRRLQDVEVRNLYQGLSTSEAKAIAREEIAKYVSGQASRDDVLKSLLAIQQEELSRHTQTKEQEERQGKRLTFRTPFGRLRGLLEQQGLKAWKDVRDDEEVTVEVRRDAEP